MYRVEFETLSKKTNTDDLQLGARKFVYANLKPIKSREPDVMLQYRISFNIFTKIRPEAVGHTIEP